MGAKRLRYLLRLYSHADRRLADQNDVTVLQIRNGYLLAIHKRAIRVGHVRQPTQWRIDLELKMDTRNELVRRWELEIGLPTSAGNKRLESIERKALAFAGPSND